MDAITKTLWNGTTFARGAIVFYHDNAVGDLAQRAAVGGYYTHCAISLGSPNNTSIEAWAGAGVRYGSAFQQVECEARMPFTQQGDVENMIATARLQLGRPYDYTAWPLAAAYARFPWSRRWLTGMTAGALMFTCSSLVGYATAALIPWNKPLRFLTVRDVWEKLNP